ncbi:MAG: YtxH domain-containing protein [Hymenobacter sp.]
MLNDKDTAGKVIFSLLAGATAGIVAGLLLAPETGEETRHGLRDSARKWGSVRRRLFSRCKANLPQPRCRPGPAGRRCPAPHHAPQCRAR